ncbi:MAG: hypothetical protein AAF203_10700 [Pseudomonadota bacterium]
MKTLLTLRATTFAFTALANQAEPEGFLPQTSVSDWFDAYGFSCSDAAVESAELVTYEGLTQYKWTLADQTVVYSIKGGQPSGAAANGNGEDFVAQPMTETVVGCFRNGVTAGGEACTIQKCEKTYERTDI